MVQQAQDWTSVLQIIKYSRSQDRIRDLMEVFIKDLFLGLNHGKSKFLYEYQIIYVLFHSFDL